MRYSSLVLSVLGAVFVGCQAPPPTDGTSTGAIIGGTTDTSDPAVVALYAQTKDSGALCTASVIAPTVLLTAAHCVAASEVGSGATFVALPSNNLNESTSERWEVKATHYDPAFDASHVENGHDIAVVVLDQPVSVTPLAVNQADVASLAGTQVRLVGYGVSNGTAQSGAGIKRTVSAAVDSVSDRLLQIGGDGKDTCQGDSGGPAIATVDGKKVIVGITSFGQQGCGGGGYDTRVDRYAAFLAPYLGAATPPPPTTPTAPPTASASETEPNDTAAEANDIELGTTAGTLSGVGDVDWFTFTVPGPSSYTITLASQRSSAMFRVYKLAESGSLSSVGASDKDTFTKGSTQGGIYYVKVVDDGKNHSDGGSYTLTLE